MKTMEILSRKLVVLFLWTCFGCFFFLIKRSFSSLLQGTQNKQARYFMAFLRLGRITVVTKEKRKFEMATQTVFNDGVWHKVNTTVYYIT